MDARTIFMLLAGITGAAGVGLSAWAAHAAGQDAETAARFLLIHAPAFLGLAALSGNRLRLAAGLALALGLVLFSGDLLMREIAGHRLFPMAAPSGGILMILGWLLVAVSAFTTSKAD